MLLVLLFGSKTGLGLTHFVETIGVVVIFIVVVFEDFFFLGTEVLILQLGDYFFLFLAALGVLEVIHIKLVLEVVNICVLFNVDGVEAFELSLKSFILFLVLGLHILDT